MKLLKTISTIKKVIINLQARHSTGVVELPAKEKIQSDECLLYDCVNLVHPFKLQQIFRKRCLL